MSFQHVKFLMSTRACVWDPLVVRRSVLVVAVAFIACWYMLRFKLWLNPVIVSLQFFLWCNYLKFMLNSGQNFTKERGCNRIGHLIS